MHRYTFASAGAHSIQCKQRFQDQLERRKTRTKHGCPKITSATNWDRVIANHKLFLSLQNRTYVCKSNAKCSTVMWMKWIPSC